MTLPNDAGILRLHEKYAPNERALAIVYGHCQIVTEIAAAIIDRQRLAVDCNFVHAAAMLHDVGYYALFGADGFVPKARIITHGVVGAEMLRTRGLPEAICRVAEHHTGVGLTREAIRKQQLPLPDRDLVPETSGEWLIAYADKLHSKFVLAGESDGALGHFNQPETYQQHIAQFGPEVAARFGELVEHYGVPDLAALAQRYRQDLC